jgi:hypothetical protein
VNKIKIESAVFCEDARQDVSGKHLLIGVSGPELDIAVIPARISVAVWIYGTASMEGPFEAEMRVLSVDKSPLIKAVIKGEIDPTRKIIHILGPMPLQIKKAGDYVFEWRSGDRKWSKIASLRLNYVPPDTATETIPNA